MSMEKISLFQKSTGEDDDETEDSITTPNVPLSPMKKPKEVDELLQQYQDNESKLIALAQIMKKDRK